MKKIVLFFAILTPLISFLINIEAKPAKTKIDFSKSPSVSIDISDPSKITFEFFLKDKFDLIGQYNPKTKYLEAKATLTNIDLSLFSNNLAFLEAGYIKKGNLKLKKQEKYLLELDLELGELIISKQKISPKTDFNLKGVVEIDEDFSSYKANLGLNSDFLNVLANAEYNKGLLVIDNLLIRGQNTNISSSANINTSSKKTEIKGGGYFSLADLLDNLDTFNLKTGKLEKSNSQGLCNIKFIATGQLTPKTWEVKLIGDSADLKIYNINSRNVKIDLYKKDNELTISPLFADLAQGKLELRSIVDLTTKNASVNLITNDIDIAQIVRDLELKENKYSGKLSLEAYLKSFDLPKGEKMDGQGKVWIKEGNVWEIDFLEGMGEFLFIPEFRSIEFTEGYSNLMFKGNDVIFDDLELTSDAMLLGGAGKISLKGDIDFMFFPKFNKEFVDSSEGFKKHITNLFGDRGLVLEITGKVKDPKYKMKPVFLSPLGRIKSFFEELFSD